ncbi:hypothetical protein [Paenibacillus sp.]|uniref:hypothetical protein n=1 Tax=Paenibacillus sp. TaxID=58172 RepID=UPI002D32A3E6|nr:hypothetical protein [Paenibacillus sp.]HZG84102.1 hypothetical protein [Paenibacillus sp.]
MRKSIRFYRLLLMVGALMILLVTATIIWYLRSDPLISNGLTIYTDPNGNKVYSIQVVNRSKSDIKLQSVKVNGAAIPDHVQLGITFNSSRLVQFLGAETDPNTKVMDLNAASIRPQLSATDMQTIFAGKMNSKKLTPIHYGVIVRYDKEPIQEVTIRYSYLGFTKVKRITHWFDSDENRK